MKTKEFLGQHGVPFISVNVLADKDALVDLKKFGGRRVPIVAQGERWVDGQLLEGLARFVGIEWTAGRLSPKELAARVDVFLSAAQRFAAQLPEDKLTALLPNLQNRKREYRALIAHVGEIVECFVELVENARRLEYAHMDPPVPPQLRTRKELLSFLGSVQRRFDAWWTRRGLTTNYSQKADVYYGEQTLHQYLERTAWHAGQHTRQLQAALAHLGVSPDGPLAATDLAGLPLPEKVFDQE